MEKKQTKISLGTAVCLFIIILLIVIIVGMYFYYSNKSSNLEKSNIEVDKMEEKEEKLQQIAIDDETKNDNRYIETEEIKVDNEKTIILNGNMHTIGFKYTELEVNTDYKKQNIEIFFDNKSIKNYKVGKIENSDNFKDEEIFVMLDYDGVEHVVISVIDEEYTGYSKYFTFVNENGEVIGTTYSEHFTTITLNENNEILENEINNNNMIFYNLPRYSVEYPVVIKYEISIKNNMLKTEINKFYFNDEVSLAGALR